MESLNSWGSTEHFSSLWLGELVHGTRRRLQLELLCRRHEGGLAVSTEARRWRQQRNIEQQWQAGYSRWEYHSASKVKVPMDLGDLQGTFLSLIGEDAGIFRSKSKVRSESKYRSRSSWHCTRSRSQSRSHSRSHSRSYSGDYGGWHCQSSSHVNS